MSGATMVMEMPRALRLFGGKGSIDDEARVEVTTEPRQGTVEMHCGYGCCNQSLYVPKEAVGRDGRLKVHEVKGAYASPGGWVYCSKEHFDDFTED